jgi:DNA-binding MarR family transcriptional regulator
MEFNGPFPSLLPLYDVVVRLETELWNGADAHLTRTVGVPLGRFEVLRAIRVEGATSRVADVAARLVITVGAASKIVDRLEAAGLVSRRANPSDRRSSLLALTAEGEDVAATATRALEEYLDERLGGALPRSDLERLVAALKRLRASLAHPPSAKAAS